MTRVTLAGHSVLGFIMRVEWNQRNWTTIPVNYNENISKFIHLPKEPDYILNVGQKN